jgi:tetratricopeptide (TPR) repeat protein
MALRGDLASVDLAQVFQMLALNKKVGLLSIQGTRMWRVLYFDPRGVTLHHNVHRILDRVLASLCRAGRLDEASVEEVRDHAARTGKPLTDSLLAGGYVQPEELEDQYRIELEEEIYDLFFCKEARFEFYEGATHLEGRDGTIDERFFYNCDSVIMEAARRIDEWTYISERVPTTAEVLVAIADSIDAEEYGPDGPALFELLDGRRNVARIVELTGLSTFQVCKVLSQLLDAGSIAPLAAEELVPLADQCMGEGRLQDAINLYERAVGLGMGLPEVHSLAAAAYQAAEEYENAIYHLECEAESRIASGDSLGAAKKLFEVRHLVPTDLHARERLVELTVGERAAKLPNFDAMAEGKQVVELLIEFGDMQRVRALLERLLLVAPEDPDLKKSLVNVHIKAGDQKRVAELYESIADDLVRANRPLEAVGYLQKILLIDRSRGGVSERVRHLYEFDERSRRRGRTLSGLAVMFCILLVSGAGYWFYNQRAEEDFARIDVHEMLAAEDFAGAAGAYEEFVRRHPLTTTVSQAESELQQIEAARQRFEARLTAERAGREREWQRVRAEYRREWARQRELFRAGRPEESLAALSRVRELVAAGTTEDLAWAHEQQVERTWTRLREHLDAAAKLANEYAEHIAAGDWQAARTVALRLHSEFETTQSAAHVGIPVQVRTRPSGARLLSDGKHLEHTVDGVTEELRTPAVVLCAAGRGEQVLTAELDGFEPLVIKLDAAKQSDVEVVLEVVADRRITFAAPVQTGIGIGQGWLAMGVRGGRLGISRTDGTNSRMVELGGLKAVDTTPVLQNGRVFFLTNENTIECLPAETSVATNGWPVSLPGGAATELVAGEGRICVVDREFVLHCWEQSTAGPLWTLSLDSAPSGPPTIERRQTYIGTQDGRVFIVDAADGQVISVLRCPAGVTTRVLCDHGTLYFGCADGNVRAVDVADGRVRWSVSVGHALADGEMAVAATRLLALDQGNNLLALSRDKGQLEGQMALEGVPQHGIKVQGNRAFMQLRVAKDRNLPTHDVLHAVAIDSMTTLWQYVDQGVVPGLPGVDEMTIAWPSAAGEVVLFR